MFYWWPLGLFSKPLWGVYAVLFIVSTILNVTSHKNIIVTAHPLAAADPASYRHNRSDMPARIR